LAQLNFTSKAVFLENSFMSNFLNEAKLFWKKCLVNSLTNYFLHRWEKERRERAAISYFFSASSHSYFGERRRKNSFIHEAVL